YTDAAVGECGGSRKVGANVIAADLICVRARAGNRNTLAGIPADDVAGANCTAANGIVARATENVDAVATVRDGSGAGGVEADDVALDHVVVGARPLDGNAVIERVSGDDVARSRSRGGRGTADRVVLRTTHNPDTSGVVAQCGRAGRVRADVVAGDDVVVRSRPADLDTVRVIATDDVTGRGRRATDERVRRAHFDPDAIQRVAEVESATDVGSDVVPGHDVVGRTGAVEGDAVLSVARDDIPFGCVRHAIAIGSDARLGRALPDQDASEGVGYCP